VALLQALPETVRLRMEGVVVDTAHSGAVALNRLDARDYDAIVTDIKMPGMDGLELLAEIRMRRPDTPTLMITGNGEHDPGADAPLTVLVEGETGTGKELVARAIHYLSSRREKPFVAVDCGAILDTLIESELFGYEKGAFTAAYQRKEGYFERAHGGTLFLDEIANVPLPTQAKLLRALQEREVQPLGSTEPIRVSARII